MEMARATMSCNLLDAAVNDFLGDESDEWSFGGRAAAAMSRHGLDVRELSNGRVGGRVAMGIFESFMSERAITASALKDVIKGETQKWKIDRLTNFVELVELAAEDGAEFTDEQMEAITEFNDLSAAAVAE